MRLQCFYALIVYTCSALQAQDDYARFPTYPAVLDSFFSNYEVSASHYSTRFEKRTTGWFVSVWYADSLIQQMPFWSLDDQEFRVLSPMNYAHPGERSLTNDAYAGGWPAANFRFCPYYGYPDWHLDVIERFGGRFDLPDSILYGVARAYASAAAGRISGGQFVSKDYQWELPDGPDCLTEDQLREYRTLADQCLSYYDTLVSHDAQFKTHIGEAALKRANEYVWYATQLRLFQNERVGEDYLGKVQYDPFYLALARNFLMSCQPNAILFTNGDTDTFPLEYVQMFEQYRTDVTLVNMSMFNLPRYIEYFTQRTSNPFTLNLADTVYARDITDFAALSATPIESISVDAFLKGVEQMHLSKAIYSVPVLDLPSRSFTLPGPAGLDTISWSLPKDYILRNGIAFYDLLRTNAWKRPIHFAVTNGPDSFIGMQDHFSLEGLTYRLTPNEMHEDSMRPGTIDDDRCLLLYMNEFDWNGMSGSTPAKIMLNANYRIHMANAAKHLCSNDRKLEAEQLLDKCMDVIPDSIYQIDRTTMAIMEAYFMCGAKEKADAVAISLVKNTLAMDLSIRDWGRLPETEPADLKEIVLQRVLKSLKEQNRRSAIKQVKQMAKTARIKG